MLSRYEPWGALRQLQNEMNRTFGQAQNDDGSNIATSGWTPAVDIKEEDERFAIFVDVPGVDSADIEVTMDNGVLSIKGERKLESEDEDSAKGYRRVERIHGTFYRRFSLPDTADAEKISARVTNGVLEVLIPKAATVQPKRIAVSA